MKKEYFEKLKLEAQAESLHKFNEIPMMSCSKMSMDEMGIGA